MKAFVAALLAATCLLALPSAALAVTYTVNTTADEADKDPGGPCETNAGAGVCSLRAAIEVANGTAGVPDEIKFAASPFNGENGDTISVNSGLPAIVDQLAIRGGQCDTAAGIKGPCAGVIRAGGGFLLVVEDDDVEIQGLALNGATTAINVFSASTGFVAKGNWIGFDLTGVASGNLNGIFLDPNSDGATIGGLEAAERNVIGGNAGIGLDLEGASEATIQGNYFGVTPKGDAAASNPTNIAITDRAGLTPSEDVAAVNNEIGAAIEGAALASDACDGGCNVISGAGGPGIELNGFGLNEKPASGPTTIHGNFIGLNAAGTAAIANGTTGIAVGGADQVTVGSGSFLDPVPPEANYLAGGNQGVATGSGSNGFEVRGNSIGVAPDGSAVTPPASHGVFVLSMDVSGEAEIEGNEVRAGSIGIEQRASGARIISNRIEGGSVGIWVWGEPGGGLIAGNTIEAPTEFGILAEVRATDIRGNTILDSGGPGIRFRNPPGIAVNGSLIGANNEDGENAIEGSEGDAIEVLEEATEPGSTVGIARNRGSSNKGLFIDLVAGANEGIVSPAFSAAIQSKAEGMAEPGATVRVFRKASAEPGELQSFLAEAVADESGKWSVTYAQVPTGAIVAATQTGETGGTSELSTATAAADPSSGGGSGGGGSGGSGGGGVIVCKPSVKAPCPGGPDRTPPQTKILKGPKGKVTNATVKFKFSSSEKGSTFRCKLDRKPYRVCKSPKTYRNLKPGKHVFKVRAVDRAGNIDPTAAKRKFTVLG